MSQKLSFSSIAATLAVLSASGLVACGAEATPPAASPADAKEVPAAAAPAAVAGDSAPATDRTDSSMAAAKPADAPRR